MKTNFPKFTATKINPAYIAFVLMYRTWPSAQLVLIYTGMRSVLDLGFDSGLEKKSD